VNNLSDYDLSLDLRIDGEHIKKTYLRARECGRILGIYKSPTSVLPFKFQELELVGTFAGTPFQTLLSPPPPCRFPHFFAPSSVGRPGHGRCSRRARNGDDRTSSLSHPRRAHGRTPTHCELWTPPRTCIRAQQEGRVASRQVLGLQSYLFQFSS